MAALLGVGSDNEQSSRRASAQTGLCAEVDDVVTAARRHRPRPRSGPAAAGKGVEGALVDGRAYRAHAAGVPAARCDEREDRYKPPIVVDVPYPGLAPESGDLGRIFAIPQLRSVGAGAGV
jgi:hypothetical protein